MEDLGDIEGGGHLRPLLGLMWVGYRGLGVWKWLVTEMSGVEVDDGLADFHMSIRG